MGKNQTLLKSQLEAAVLLLKKLSEELSPQYIGLITTSGHTLTSLAATGFNGDSDSLASLASGSFAATREMARLMDDFDFTVMLHEGNNVNIYIVQVTDDVLLVICFGKKTHIGKVRLLAGRMTGALAEALRNAPPELTRQRLTQADVYAEGVGRVIDELFDVEGEQHGPY